MQTNLSSTVFLLEQCQAFARISGDANPLHVDEIYARRSIAGTCAVHGILVLLRTLEAAFSAGVKRPTRIQAHFRKFIPVGEQVDFSLVEKPGSKSLALRASVGGKPHAEISLFFPALPIKSAVDRGKEPKALESFRTVPLDEPPGFHLGKEHALDLMQYDTMDAFPECVKTLGDRPTRALCATTYFVGMVCPGMNSIYSSLDVSLEPASTEDAIQSFSLTAFDERAGRFEISLWGTLGGTLTAFGRPSPVKQEHISCYASKVGVDDFSGINALVLGGSRGLGAAAAKMLSQGGAQVAITYATGRVDAEALATEIEEFRGVKTALWRFDVTKDRFEAIASAVAGAEAVLYFATPKIRAGTPRSVDRQLFDAYFGFYVEKLLELCSLIETSRQGNKVVYFPSSIFVESGSKGFVEYAMAKAAAEALAADINASFRFVRVVTTRLPQLKTDQTASLFDLKYGSTFDNLQSVLTTVAESMKAGRARTLV